MLFQSRLFAPLVLLLAGFGLAAEPCARAEESTYRDAPQIAVLAVPDVVRADEQARELLAQIQEKLKSSSQRVRRVKVFWVSPDKHINPQTEAMLRVLHLGLQTPGLPERQIVRGEHVSPEELERIATQAAAGEERAFTRRLEFFKEMTTDAPLGGALTAKERGLVRRFFGAAKVRALQNLGIPNGAQIRKYYKLENISRQELLINLASGAVRLGMQYLIADNFLRGEFGDGFWPMMAWSTASTIFTSIFTEASRDQRTQGVSFNSRTGRMESGAWGYQIVSSIVESILLVRAPSALLGYGFGTGITVDRLWQVGETSTKSTFSKALWEKKTRAMKDREDHEDAKRMRRDPQARPRHRYQRPSFWANQALALGLSVAAFVDQYGGFPVVRGTLLAMGVAGFVYDSFVVRRDRTYSGLSRLWRRLRGRSAEEGCAALLQVEYEDIPPLPPPAGPYR